MNFLLPNIPVPKPDAPNPAWAQVSSSPPHLFVGDIYQTLGLIFNRKWGWSRDLSFSRSSSFSLNKTEQQFSFLQETPRGHSSRAALSRTPAARFPLLSPATHSSAGTLTWGLCLRDWRFKLVPTRWLSLLFAAETRAPIILVTRKIRHHNKSAGTSLRAHGFAQILLLASETLAQGRQQSGKCQLLGDGGSGLKEGEGRRVPSIFRLTEVKEFF